MAHDNWYTPPDIIERARSLMGSIDFDPTSSELANNIVKAGKYWTVEDDALGPDPWPGGNTWMNPPYSRDAGTARPFVERIVHEYNNGDVHQAVILVNASTSTKWWHFLAENSLTCLYGPGRIKFLEEVDGRLVEGSSPRYANSIHWLPPKNIVGTAQSLDDWKRAFGDIGCCSLFSHNAGR